MPDHAISPNVKAASMLNGFVVGAPLGMDISKLEDAYTADFQLVSGTLAFRYYADQTDPRTVIQAGDPFALQSIRRLDEGIYDLRLDFLRVPGYPDDSWQRNIYGLAPELVLSLPERTHEHWARLVESGGLATTLDIAETAVDAVTQTRAYETRYSPLIGVFSAIIADGETWTITGVDEIGRRRMIRIECERTVRRAV